MFATPYKFSMRPSRLIANIAGYYVLVSCMFDSVGKRFSFFQFVGVIMGFLSTFSILAYNCYFHDIFTESPVGYMFHLLYYRSHHCDSFVDWTLLGIENMTSLVEPQMSHETEMVTRTFWIAVIQLIFSCLLIVTTSVMLGIARRLRM